MLHSMLLSVSAAAALMGISARSLYNYCATGTFPCVRIGRRVMIRKADLEALLNEVVDIPRGPSSPPN
jgi:excisionase family DNA binding protein